jgi:lipid A disaccharide synthetase
VCVRSGAELLTCAFVPIAVPKARHGVAATFMGHPVLEECAWRGGEWHAAGSGDSAAALCDAPPGAGPLLCVLPGSRAQEVARHMPLFGAAPLPLPFGCCCGALG